VTDTVGQKMAVECHWYSGRLWHIKRSKKWGILS